MTKSGSYVASGQHSGIDFNGASLTGKRTITRQNTVETSGVGKKRRVTMRTKVVPKSGLNTSNVRGEEPIYDKHLLANMGSQRLVALSMKAGSRLGHVDRIGPFLKNLQQNGKITMAWNGTLQTTNLDNRHVSMQVFRHSLSDNDANITNMAYPITSGGDYLPHILYPASSFSPNAQYTPYITGKPSAGDTIKFPFYAHPMGEVSFSPLNLPDMEDMSWNLNKLKLAPTNLNPNMEAVVSGDVEGTCDGAGNPLLNGTIVNGTVVLPQPGFMANVPSYEKNAHRRQSTLRQNNFDAVRTAALKPSPTYDETVNASTYLYDACIRYGTIQYEFMNKQDTGATVEVILYKVKQNHPCASNDASYQSMITLNQNAGSDAKAMYPLSILVDSVSKGYKDTVGQDYSTENFTGREPDFVDVYNNPNYPLLPNKLKKTVEGDLPLSEVMRNKFVMSAGSRRNLTLHLPGLLYNPASKPTHTDTTTIYDDNVPYQGVPICDKDTYCVVLSCNGQKMTRFFDNKPKSGVDAVITNTYRVTWTSIVATAQQGSGLDPLTAPLPIDQSPYMWVADYDSTNVFSIQSGNTQTYNLTIDPNEPLDSQSTVDVKYIDYAGTATHPTGYSRYCIYSNFHTNGDPISWNVNYTMRNMIYVRSQDLTITATFAPSFYLHSFGTVSTTATPAVLPTEMAMGDNHGPSHIDYCATYTEHIGACVYKDKKERNLYDCGRPEPPDLVTASDSITSSRMILPAVNVVRQAKRVGYEIDEQGSATNLNVERATSNN